MVFRCYPIVHFPPNRYRNSSKNSWYQKNFISQGNFMKPLRQFLILPERVWVKRDSIFSKPLVIPTALTISNLLSCFIVAIYGLLDVYLKQPEKNLSSANPFNRLDLSLKFSDTFCFFFYIYNIEVGLFEFSKRRLLNVTLSIRNAQTLSSDVQQSN